MSTGPFSKYMLNLSSAIVSVYKSTGTFTKDIVDLSFGLAFCQHVYRLFFGEFSHLYKAMGRGDGNNRYSPKIRL